MSNNLLIGLLPFKLEEIDPLFVEVYESNARATDQLTLVEVFEIYSTAYQHFIHLTGLYGKWWEKLNQDKSRNRIDVRQLETPLYQVVFAALELHGVRQAPMSNETAELMASLMGWEASDEAKRYMNAFLTAMIDEARQDQALRQAA